MHRIYLLFFVALFSQITWSQEYQPVERFTMEEGLSDDEVTYLFEDYSGFLWIGTRDGLNRFDGNSFDRYNVDLSDFSALPGSTILRVFEDTENQLWVLTDRGISRLKRSENAFQTFFVYSDSLENKPPSNLKDAALNWKENQILLLGGGILNLLDIGTGVSRRVSIPESLGIESFSSFSSLQYNGLTDAFYIFSKSRLLQFSLINDSISFLKIEDEKLLNKDGGILGLECGVNGECWLYSNRHIWQLDSNGKFIQYKSKLDIQDDPILFIKHSLPDQLQIITASSVLKHSLVTGNYKTSFKYSNLPGDSRISSVLTMDEGIFWLGTTMGLFQYNEHGYSFKSENMSNVFSDEASIEDIAYDDKDNLWVGSESGEILVLEEPNDFGKINILARRDFQGSINSIKSVHRKDTVIVASDAGLFMLSRSKQEILADKLFAGSVDAIDNVRNDSITFLSGDSIVSLSFLAQYRVRSRKMDIPDNLPVIDVFRKSGFIYLLQKHQMIKYSLKDSSHLILSLAETGLNALPVNTCFLPSNSREIIIGTTMGMYIYYPNDLKVLPSYINLEIQNSSIKTIHQDTNQILWFASKNGIYSLDRMNNELNTYSTRDGITFPKSGFKDTDINSKGGRFFAGERQILFFHPDSIRIHSSSPKVKIKRMEFISQRGAESLELLESDTLTLRSRFTLLRFYCAVLDYWDPQVNLYQYSLTAIGKEDKWSDISSENVINVPRLKAGSYVLKLRGSNSRHIWSTETDEIVLQIIAPLWRSRMAIIAYIAFIILSFYFSIFFTTRHLRKLNKEYKERELIAKKVEQQKEELTQKNKNITDSINYAKRIQMALMPSQRLFSKVFPDSFILHIPKDIVSGDFYWINQVDGRIYFAAVDCTGHGVPGAFMSIIGFELFRRITEIEKKKRPAEILNSLSQGFETIFRDIEDITLRDGMDVAFCAIDPEMKTLEFAGAFNPLYLIRDNTISEIKGDRFSVGLNQTDDGITPQEFKDHVIQLKDGDILYIFTDGYADQFGGPEGKKYKYRRFRHLLLALHQLPMDRQVEFLRRSIMDWKGELDQVDDILVMGIRIAHKK